MKRNVLVVGVGSIGERHLRCFLSTGRARVSFCEINDALRERIAQTYDVTRCYPDLESALDGGSNDGDVHGGFSHGEGSHDGDSHDGAGSDRAFDAAVVAVPAHLHIAVARELAEAGLHLLIEKPLSVCLDGIDTLEQVARQRRLCVTVGYALRHHPALRAMKRAIASGRFGRPLQLVATSGQNFPTYRPAYREIYYADRSTGGGAVQDALTHLINAGEWLVGPVDELVADIAHQSLDGVDVEDTAHMLARQGDVLASYSLNQYQAPNESMITVVCEHGTCRAVMSQQRWQWMVEPDTPWKEDVFPKIARDDLFIQQANAFLDLIDGRAEPTCSLTEATQTLRTCLAALASAQDRSWKSTSEI